MNRTTLLAAVAIAILGAVLFLIRKERYTDKITGGYLVPVVAVIQDVREGSPLAPVQLGIIQRPPAHVEERHVLGEDLGDVLGVPARYELRAGATLRWSDVEADAQERGTPSELLARPCAGPTSKPTPRSAAPLRSCSKPASARSPSTPATAASTA